MISRILFFFSVFLLPTHSLVSGQHFDENYLPIKKYMKLVKNHVVGIPISFKDESEALSKNCKIHRLKDKDKKNCVIEEREYGGVYTKRAFYQRSIILNIYEQNSAGEFYKDTEFTILSPYGRAKIRYEDLLGDGKEFIIVENLEGATGSGVSQDILAIVGWHRNKFAPVLLETTRYMEAFSTSHRQQELRASYNFLNKGTNNLSIRLEYEFLAIFSKLNITKQLSWNEELAWNEENFSFYSKELEKVKLNNFINNVEKSIIQVRLNILDLDINNLSFELLDKTKIVSLYTKWF